MASIGRRNTLTLLRIAAPGAYLDGGELGEILLPGREIPHDTRTGDSVDVFIHHDSEDRLIATTKVPAVGVGEFACLRVASVHPRIGAFLEWGLPKDLLLPFREQVGPLREGDRVVVHVHIDERTGRITASAKLDGFLDVQETDYLTGEPVDLLITDRTPLGYKAIIDNAHRGLIYHTSVVGPMEIGQRVKGYIREVRPDGKIDLTLHEAGYQRVAPLTGKILAALEAGGGKLAFDDDSPPEAIRAVFGVSKKAFKQALGALLKHRQIHFTHPGVELNSPSVRARRGQ
ncbi:MAG: GntR family transcriptional regulator [Verrucomicrobia bacterium]|nr:GntR family transcriptional regulator [Verrucomicrobiota bacterium]